jgi:glycosyltransferase involved in cell wall biosynthesis
MKRRVMLMASSLRGGGSERQTLMLLHRLDRNQFSPQLYLIDREGELLDQVPDDVPIHCFGDAARNNGWYYPGRVLRQQIRHVRQILSQHSVDVVYDRTFHMTMIADPACAKLRVPRVSTIVSPPHLALPMVERRFVGIKRRRLAKAYRRARRVVAVSQQAADSAERYYHLPNGWVQVVVNPVDVDETRRLASFDTVSRDARLTLVSVGRMTSEKGQHDLIEAILRCEQGWPDSLPPMRLWMIGDGPLRSELESLWRDRSQGFHTVEFLGAQRNAAPYIDAADALVLPSLFEGMPNVVLEAMALERPVIATRAGGTQELERQEPTIQWAEPGNPQSLAQAIRAFALNRIAAAERVQAASRLIRQHHDPNRLTRTIESLLLEA